MSKDYHNICNKIMQTNHDLYSGPNLILKELDSIKKEMNRISSKLDQIYRLLLSMKDDSSY